MLSRYEDKTGFVECEFRVSVSKGQGKVSVTSVMSTVISCRRITGYQSLIKPARELVAKE
jgi:hypothetical protein